MLGYTSSDVAKLFDLSVAQVRSYVRNGFLEPERGPRGEYRFSFQDLVLLRTAKELLKGLIPARRVRTAMRKLKKQLPRGRPLSGVQVTALGDRIVVRDADALWNPESGQVLFNFGASEIARKVRPLARKASESAIREEKELRAEDWFDLGCESEACTPRDSRNAYRRALELDPSHVDARVNLGRLLHEAGLLSAAEAHYRLALKERQDDPTALFNLAVVLEDQGRSEEAVFEYQRTIACDPRCADAYYNAARLCEDLGRSTLALRYLRTYKALLRD